MSCERWRDAISAELDGEPGGIEPRLVAAHLATCGGCREFGDAARTERARYRIHVAEPTPDLSGRVRRAAAVADRAASWSIVRVVLAVVALEVIAFSLPALLFGNEQDPSAHDSRHLAAFSIAYGVGLLVVVNRPARARTMLPVAAVLGGTLLLTAVVDLINGKVPLISEATHIPELISVGLLWALAVPTGRAPRRLSLRRVDEQRQTHNDRAAG